MTSDPVKSTMATSAARGAGVTMAGQIARVLVQSTSLIVLTRLLAPEDYGLLAMVLVIVALGELFREFGLTAASVQSTSLDDQERDTLFWINTLVGMSITVVVASCSGLIAVAYGDSRLQMIALAISPIFVLNGGAAQFRASLMRQVRFVPIAVADTLAQVVGFAGALASIYFWNLDYWSLVVQQLLVFLTTTAVLIAAAGWVPALTFKTNGMRRFYTFGMDYTVTQILVYISQNVSTVIIGRNFGAVEVGYFSRAMQLASLPITQISGPATNVSLPILARLKADKPLLLRYARAGQICITHIIAFVTGLALPFMGVLVTNVLGTKWNPIVDLLSFLLIASVFQALSFPTFWIFVSLGLTRSNLYYAACTRLLQITALFSAALVSIWLSALTVAITSIILWPFGLLWLKYFHKIAVNQLFAAGVRTVSIYGLASIVVWAAVKSFSLTSPTEAALMVSLYILICASSYTVPLCRTDYRILVAIASRMIGRGTGGHAEA